MDLDQVVEMRPVPLRSSIVIVPLWILATSAFAAAGAGPLPARQSTLAQRLAVAFLRPSYGTILTKVGSSLTPETPAWNDALERSVSVFLAARPSDCALPLWALMLCGNHVYDVPSPSMEPAIQASEEVIAVAVTKTRPVLRGDVVSYKDASSSEQAGTTHAHRVIGLPGERVALVDGIVRIDGRPLPLRPIGEPIESDDGTGPRLRFVETTPEGMHYEVIWPADHQWFAGRMNMAEMVIPPEHYFLLGDNRGRSLDSRYAQGPGLPRTSEVQARITSIFASRETSRIGPRLGP